LINLRRAAFAAAVCVGAATGLPAGDVAAHASLVSTDPTPDSVLEAGPLAVALQFDEPVTIDLAGIRVFGPDGQRVDAGPTRSLDGGTSPSVDIDAAAVGTYTVAWKVVSADSHVLSGTFLFHVQTRSERRRGR